MTNQDKKGFAKWLETLQQESWQLELIISGFAIFLLIGVYEPMNNWNYDVNSIIYLNSTTARFFFLFVGFKLMFIAWYVLVINLVVHVLLRGFWISTVGLRYVSGDIDFDSLNFNKQFNQFLKENVSNFDDYIERLEKICSVIFSFTFLILFVIISFAGFTFLIGCTGVTGYYLGLEEYFNYINLFWVMGIGLYALDFLTLGWFKKQEKLSKIYYPFYRFFSFVTFSSLYRPLYYNLIDNKFGRWVGLIIIPYILLLLTVSYLKISLYDYLPYFRIEQVVNNNNYDNTAPKTNFLNNSIPSKFIDNSFLEIFLPYVPNYHDSPLAEICPDLKPGSPGITLDYFIKKADNPKRLLNADSTLTCFSQIHQIIIDDSLQTDVTYRFYYHRKREKQGLLTIIDIDHLSRGEHILRIKSKRRDKPNKTDSLVFRQQDVIPFWKE